MLADSRFDPVTEMGESIDGLEIDHRSLQPLGESLEELLADHGFVNVILPHPDHMFEICYVFVNIASLHFESKDVSSGKILAHVILECFGEVVDDCGPDPFICVPSSEGDMFSN